LLIQTGGGLTQDGFHVVHESHVEHLIRLVQHAEAQGLEGQGAALEQVLRRRTRTIMRIGKRGMREGETWQGI